MDFQWLWPFELPCPGRKSARALIKTNARGTQAVERKTLLEGAKNRDPENIDRAQSLHTSSLRAWAGNSRLQAKWALG